MSRRVGPGDRSEPRRWLALLFLVAAYLLLQPAEDLIYPPLAALIHAPKTPPDTIGLPRFAILMTLRLALNALVVAGVIAILRRRFGAFPLVGPRMSRLTLIGLLTGLAVMIAAILAILATGSATVGVAPQSAGSAAGHGLGWLALDYFGALEEELFGRVALLLVAERFVGWRGAMIASGLVFALVHLGNPGASPIWLGRLFCQGVLLAYAVYRTGSLWWSVGYHAGWNWASAPLFGAAGSGYLDEGHLLDFAPTGSAWITGGAVGPEGSIFAFVAVACAFGLLIATTARRG